MAVWELDDELWFPNPKWGEADGLVAIGGDLSVERLLLAYSNGFFPWYAFQMESQPHWYCPLRRYVIFPKDIHVSHSMRQLLKHSLYEVTVNQDFEGVINGCSHVNGRHEEMGAWLGSNIIEAYTELHRKGYAASVEVWQPSDSEGMEVIPSGESIRRSPVEEAAQSRPFPSRNRPQISCGPPGRKDSPA